MKSLILGAAAMMAAAGAARAGSVQVTLSGVQPRGGHIYAALQTREEFMKRGSTASASLPGDASGEAKLTLPDVPQGDYALSVLHDADDNHRMTLGPDGRPLEGWSMENAAALRAKPAFDQVRVHVPASGAAIVLPMIYPTATTATR